MLFKDKYIDEYPKLEGFEWDQAMVDKGHNTTSHLNERGPCPRCKKLLKAARDKRYRLKQEGWVVYPHAKPNGDLREDLATIQELLGSILYEWRKDDDVIRIRRVDD